MEAVDLVSLTAVKKCSVPSWLLRDVKYKDRDFCKHQFVIGLSDTLFRASRKLIKKCQKNKRTTVEYYDSMGGKGCNYKKNIFRRTEFQSRACYCIRCFLPVTVLILGGAKGRTSLIWKNKLLNNAQIFLQKKTKTKKARRIQGRIYWFVSQNTCFTLNLFYFWRT